MQESNDAFIINIALKYHKITFRLEKTDTGYSAFALKLPVFTTGISFTQLRENAAEACALYYEGQGMNFKSSDLRFEIDFRQFFLYYRVLNAKFLAEKIGMNPTLLSQYVQGHKKPSKTQTERILRGIQQIGKELMELGMIQP